MVKLKIITDKDKKDTEDMIKLAISAEIKRIEISLKKTDENIKKFEKRYNITSEYFLRHYSAEDLNNGDDEYICWVGEIEMRKRILSNFNKLKAIKYESN